MTKPEKKTDNVSNGILYGLILGTFIYALTKNPIYFSLIGPGAFLGLLFDLSAGRVPSNHPIGIPIGIVFGLLIGLILFLTTHHVLWFALAIPGAFFGLFFDPSIRVTKQEQ